MSLLLCFLIQNNPFHVKQNQWSCIIQASGATYVSWKDVLKRDKHTAMPESVIVCPQVSGILREQLVLRAFSSVHFISAEWFVVLIKVFNNTLFSLLLSFFLGLYNA